MGKYDASSEQSGRLPLILLEYYDPGKTDMS